MGRRVLAVQTDASIGQSVRAYAHCGDEDGTADGVSWSIGVALTNGFSHSQTAR
jgi:hypothetical protein